MWTTLESMYRQKKAGSCFKAYDNSFSIRKSDDESLQSLINRVDESMKLCQSLRPKDFDLKALDKELTPMVLIRALPDKYSHFVSSLLPMDKLHKDTVQQVFLTEEIQCRHCAADAVSVTAMARVCPAWPHSQRPLGPSFGFYAGRIPVLRKSETFNAFKQFKALAENQLGRKIKALHDDKGRERANRTMLEDVTAMLAQANLPVRFWGRCLATQVKVWNCLPTASLPDKTPFEAWFCRKPDLSCFRVFGCTPYVFVQKDKRKKLDAWTFYNPVTKQFIISECAEFDERMFPGLSTKETTPNAQLRLLETPPSQPARSNSVFLPIPPELRRFPDTFTTS
ncbi:hypothetical protein EST38_g13780 [Candolleomyces aberdarensis]|uniref:Uncharacterized protein n=1 Tax=Candolleomyces aberdarensis TaxID=2316362 RepID=A0A4Q2D1D3_9AGAR|nr:hypothetical protein EST38_g13780 [Candolleomyces aberdarensis]